MLAEFRPGRAATSDPSADIKAVAACAEKASRAARIVNRDRDEVEVFESMLEELPEAVQLYDEAIGECPPSQPGCGAQIQLQADEEKRLGVFRSHQHRTGKKKKKKSKEGQAAAMSRLADG